jgi:RNA polymerase sigma-70 factor (ECF subfamily)
MDDEEWLAGHFERHRPHLRAVAYRMLGSLTEADDAVQDTWVRLSRSGADDVENLGGWLTTVVARVCLNMLRARSRRREEPLAVRIPDPVITPEGGGRPLAVMSFTVADGTITEIDIIADPERVRRIAAAVLTADAASSGPSALREARTRLRSARARECLLEGLPGPRPPPGSPEGTNRW